MERPVSSIPEGPLDRILEVISLLSVFSSVALTIWHYTSLPESVPSHFNAAGNPDAYSSKPVMWILPVISILTYAGLTVLGRYPHNFNYPFAITETNAKGQYTNAVQALRWTKAIVLGQLASLVFFQHRVAMGWTDGLPPWWLPVSVGCVLVALLVFVVRAFRRR